MSKQTSKASKGRAAVSPNVIGGDRKDATIINTNLIALFMPGTWANLFAGPFEFNVELTQDTVNVSIHDLVLFSAFKQADQWTIEWPKPLSDKTVTTAVDVVNAIDEATKPLTDEDLKNYYADHTSEDIQPKSFSPGYVESMQATDDLEQTTEDDLSDYDATEEDPLDRAEANEYRNESIDRFGPGAP